MSEHMILMQPGLVRQTYAGVKTETRRLNLRWIKAQAGDILLVRETWATSPEFDAVKPSELPGDAPIIYRAAYPEILENPSGVSRWRPSIFLPKRFVRLRLRMVEDARREPLHAITEDGAKREGATNAHYSGPVTGYRTGFERLWCDINGRESWEANPDVIVLPYKLEGSDG